MGTEGTRVMSLRLAEDLAAEMAAICRVDDVTVSEGIRAAIYRHIAARRADKRFQERLREQLEKDREVLEGLAE